VNRKIYAFPILILIGIGLFCLASVWLDSPVVSSVDNQELALPETKSADQFAQQDFQQQRRRRWRRQRDPNDRGGVPLWKNEQADPDDVFTFVRIRYDSYGKILQLTDPELFKYPFIYIIEPGGMTLSDAEVAALREYLLRGGFLMVDDFWGEAEWENFAFEFGRVFPDRPIEDIPLEHEIFNIVYKIKKKPLIPSVHAYQNGNWTERWDALEAHYRGVKDDNGRLMTVICHNTDLGDGWEQEGTDPGYFEEYSERYAYPLGINIVTYAMTH